MPRINIAESLQVEQTGRMTGVIEHVGRGLVNRYSPGTGYRVGNLSCMQAKCFYTKFFISHGSFSYYRFTNNGRLAEITRVFTPA